MPCGLGCAPRHTIHGVSPFFAPDFDQNFGRIEPKIQPSALVFYCLIFDAIRITVLNIIIHEKSAEKLTGYRYCSATSRSTARQAKGKFRGFGGRKSQGRDLRKGCG